MELTGEVGDAEAFETDEALALKEIDVQRMERHIAANEAEPGTTINEQDLISDPAEYQQCEIPYLTRSRLREILATRANIAGSLNAEA